MKLFYLFHMFSVMILEGLVYLKFIHLFIVHSELQFKLPHEVSYPLGLINLY